MCNPMNYLDQNYPRLMAALPTDVKKVIGIVLISRIALFVFENAAISLASTKYIVLPFLGSGVLHLGIALIVINAVYRSHLFSKPHKV